MANAVVVATVVQTNMSDAAFRQAVLDQIRDSERDLRATLADRDGEANVVTAILDVDEFMKYMLQRFPRPADTAPAPHESKPRTTVLTETMSEVDFMNHILDQAQAGLRQTTVHFDEADYDALDDEIPGEDFARNPFLY
jgi:hypothetical protein